MKASQVRHTGAMKALQYDEYGSPPQIVQTSSPQCPADGIVIAVRATGVCRSDWHAWQGHDPVRLPCVPGHEYAGVVTSVGPDVRRWSMGDRVTAPFVLGCGVCPYCLAGDAQVCPDQRQPGFTDPGSFAELVAVPRADFNVVAMPDNVDFVSAAALGCRFATAFRALTSHARVQPGEWVAVHGCGGVGLSAVMIAVALGARVIAVDLSEAALARAGQLGAEQLVNTRAVPANGEGSRAAGTSAAGTPDVALRVIALTGGGAHVSIDAIGHPDAAAASVNCLRRRGRHVQIGLLFGTEAAVAMPMDRVIALELEIYGSHGMAAHEYPAMLDLVASGALRPAELVASVIGLDAAAQALAAMGRPGAGGMTVITPAG